MFKSCRYISITAFSILNFLISGVIPSTTFTMINKCEHTVWPGILSNAGIAPLSTTGFALQNGESRTVPVPFNWGGRFWGRTLCSGDSATGTFVCVTGDCGTGKMECSGRNAIPPATLAEFTLDGYGGQDFYDVSLVDGYNLPMLVVPQGGAGDNCTTTGCTVDLNGVCPSQLKVTGSTATSAVSSDTVVACKSACEALRQDEYCCSGSHATPDTCKPSVYSQVFKRACPLSYSYAYDDKTSTFTCAGANSYLITFCPMPNTSQKATDDKNSTINNAMVYEGALAVSGESGPSTWKHRIGYISVICHLAFISIHLIKYCH